MTVADTEENIEKCICSRCLGYPGEGILFCAKGKSTKPVSKMECDCVECDVWQEQIRLACHFCIYGVAP